MHLSAGDGFVTMADGRAALHLRLLGPDRHPAGRGDDGRACWPPTFPAPTIAVDEGDELYLTLTNVGMAMRPDLFDPHTVHWHGFPNAAPIFDGVPEAVDRHQHGRDADLLLQGRRARDVHVPLPRRGDRAHADGHARQPLRPPGAEQAARRDALPNGFAHQTGFTYAYNDGDGSTRYDVDAADPARLVRPGLPRRERERPAAAVREHARPLPDAQRPRLPRHGEPGPLDAARRATAASSRRSRRPGSRRRSGSASCCASPTST